jgi:hypothetical protein
MTKVRGDKETQRGLPLIASICLAVDHLGVNSVRNVAGKKKRESEAMGLKWTGSEGKRTKYAI